MQEILFPVDQLATGFLQIGQRGKQLPVDSPPDGIAHLTNHRLRDGSRLLVIMEEYDITDAASYAEAVKKVNTKFYNLRSKRKENADLSTALSARIDAYETWKKYRKYHKAWEKPPDAKRSVFERSYEFELRKYRNAVTALHRWQDDGEKIDCKGWKSALDYLNKERFMLDYQLQAQKEEVRRLEVVKREFIRENKMTRPDRYAR